MSTANFKPAVYVGTYAKYNNGSIKGEWLQLENYSNTHEFYNACKELHNDEYDPEFMFQDFEDIPEGMISESFISPDIWEWIKMSDNDKQLLAVYREHIDRDGNLSDAEDSFHGIYKNPADYAQERHEESGSLTNVPPSICYHIDWEGVARDMSYENVHFVQVAHEECWVFSC